MMIVGYDRTYHFAAIIAISALYYKLHEDILKSFPQMVYKCFKKPYNVLLCFTQYL